MTLEYFLRRPTLDQWENELALGWDGPNGSTVSTDDIMGIRIGITSPSWHWLYLPANLHDWRYRLGRRLKLPRTYRRAADWDYLVMCIEITDKALIGWRKYVARSSAWGRYIAIRTFGGLLW